MQQATHTTQQPGTTVDRAVLALQHARRGAAAPAEAAAARSLLDDRLLRRLRRHAEDVARERALAAGHARRSAAVRAYAA